MKLILLIHRYLSARRVRRHRSWCKRAQVIYTTPAADHRRWSDAYMDSYRSR